MTKPRRWEEMAQKKPEFTRVDEVRILDVREPTIVEVVVSLDFKKLWINVDGLCLLRAQEIKTIILPEVKKPNE